MKNMGHELQEVRPAPPFSLSRATQAVWTQSFREKVYPCRKFFIKLIFCCFVVVFFFRIRKGINVLVATPGRLLDHIEVHHSRSH